ncbi:hypothetical protein ZIOFF_006067 [Zingiber officinale]|uniref:Uncharacterized protein n=1 Tax=Zingiber officinale TaxID=94328 RepID=A0A8J5M4T5_ZINOF|nr:hypothetical protein ZIOFF_006067 [Zingiber officinale]
MPHSALNPSTPTLALVARRRSWLPSLELRPSISRRAELHRGYHSWARSAIDAAAHRTGVECDMKEGRDVSGCSSCWGCFDWLPWRCCLIVLLVEVGFNRLFLEMFRLASALLRCVSDMLLGFLAVLSAFGWKRILRYTLLEDLTDICLAGLILDSSFPLGMKFWVQLRILVEIWVWILHVVPLDTISLLCDVDFDGFGWLEWCFSSSFGSRFLDCSFKELMGFGCSVVAHDDYITGEDVSLDTTEGLWTE